MAQARVSEYFRKRKLIDRLSKEVATLEVSEAIKPKLGLQNDIAALLEKNDIEPQELIDVITALYDDLLPSEVVQDVSGSPDESQAHKDSSAKADAQQPVSGGAVTPRRIKRYTNPNTGEVVETRGSNHRILNAWRQSHGHEAVDSWWVFADSN